MTTAVQILSDFMHAPSVIPLDENCPKCAFRLNGRCVRKWTKECDFGRRGYHALVGKVEEVESYEDET